MSHVIIETYTRLVETHPNKLIRNDCAYFQLIRQHLRVSLALSCKTSYYCTVHTHEAQESNKQKKKHTKENVSSKRCYKIFVRETRHIKRIAKLIQSNTLAFQTLEIYNIYHPPNVVTFSVIRRMKSRTFKIFDDVDGGEITNLNNYSKRKGQRRRTNKKRAN